MSTPQITTEHYFEGGVPSGGLARCRGGHTLMLPDQEFGDWTREHGACAPATPPKPATTVSTRRVSAAELRSIIEGRAVLVPIGTLERLAEIAAFVARGRGAIDQQPDGDGYPDRSARTALGELTDAGLREARRA